MGTEVTRRLFTADEYGRMVDAGVLAEDDHVELIDGEIISLTPIGPRHGAAVDRALKAFVMGCGDAAIVRVQGSVRLNLFTQPEPDIVLLRPREDFYASRLPGAADIILIVEVAESSLAYDRDVKALVYAKSDVAEYWLVDLNEGVINCYAEPHEGVYQVRRHVGRGTTLAPSLLRECVIPAAALLA
jgi:Uma2 family endonuclease